MCALCFATISNHIFTVHFLSLLSRLTIISLFPIIILYTFSIHFILATRHACAFFHRNDQFLWVNREWSNVMYAMVCLNTYKSPVERGPKLKHTSMGDLRNRSRQVQLNTASNGIFFLAVLFRYSNCTYTHTIMYLRALCGSVIFWFIISGPLRCGYGTLRLAGLMLHFSVCVVIRFTWSFFCVPPLALATYHRVSEWDMILIYLRARYAYMSVDVAEWGKQMVSNGLQYNFHVHLVVSWLNCEWNSLYLSLLCDYGSSGSTLMWRIYEKENIDVDMYIRAGLSDIKLPCEMRHRTVHIKMTIFKSTR
jgi:hypothetical protein